MKYYHPLVILKTQKVFILLKENLRKLSYQISRKCLSCYPLQFQYWTSRLLSHQSLLPLRITVQSLLIPWCNVSQLQHRLLSLLHQLWSLEISQWTFLFLLPTEDCCICLSNWTSHWIWTRRKAGLLRFPSWRKGSRSPQSASSRSMSSLRYSRSRLRCTIIIGNIENTKMNWWLTYPKT